VSIRPRAFRKKGVAAGGSWDFEKQSQRRILLHVFFFEKYEHIEFLFLEGTIAIFIWKTEFIFSNCPFLLWKSLGMHCGKFHPLIFSLGSAADVSRPSEQWWVVCILTVAKALKKKRSPALMVGDKKQIYLILVVYNLYDQLMVSWYLLFIILYNTAL